MQMHEFHPIILFDSPGGRTTVKDIRDSGYFTVFDPVAGLDVVDPGYLTVVDPGYWTFDDLDLRCRKLCGLCQNLKELKGSGRTNGVARE